MKKIIVGLLVLMLICSLIGCGNTNPTTTPTTQTITPTTQATEPAFADTYAHAAAPLRDAQDLRVKLTTKKNVIALGGTFSSVSQQELILTDLGTDDFAATLNESLGIGGYKDEFVEVFSDGVLYVSINDSGLFQGEMTADDFVARFSPAVLLDETLYADISSEDSDSGILLTFSDPSGPESWVLPETAEFLSATGTAEITDDGTLAKTAYSVDYIEGNTTVFLEITAEAEIYDDARPEVPQNPDRYITIDSIEAPRLFDIASLYILCSQTVSSTIDQTIISQAAAYMQVEQTQLHYMGTGKDHLSSVQQDITSVDSNNNTNVYSLTEKFQDGKYTYAENGVASAPDSSVNATAMFEYVHGLCYGNLPSLAHMTSAKIENINGLLYMEMELIPEWGELTAKELSYQLFQDENFLDGFATAYETTSSSFFLSLDAATGFPVATGISYAGAHTIDGEKYLLSQEVAQRFRLLDSSTYTELTDEISAETTPEEQATPLLYRVTGTNGQEMYLMGTIHVGDAKTGFLPDEVYAAFNASDALAVEADVPAFEEKIEADPQLAAKLSELFMNTDGSTTKDHLDPDLYEQAVKLLKVTGNYDSSIEYLKPYMWYSFIDEFFMTVSNLRSEKGMDLRLLMLAKEQNKKVLEVESSMDQYEMLTGFSSDLQATMLEEIVSVNVTDYRNDMQDLYDQWCAGDEETLRAVLDEDTSNLTDEELSLYQEYTDAMIIKRNENMLDVAVSYLEGEETVFFAVGLAHLLQENGLVDTLREAGYTVEQVVYN